MLYYKVVKVDVLNELVSSTAYGFAEVIYKIGEFVSAPDFLLKEGYGCCVWPDIKNAVNFMKELYSDSRFASFKFKVFSCEIQDEIPVPVFQLAVWKTCVEGFTSSIYEKSFPAATVMTKRVKLIEEVEKDEK
jgi:hypothetical protein